MQEERDKAKEELMIAEEEAKKKVDDAKEIKR